jgi:hypothetical protein
VESDSLLTDIEQHRVNSFENQNAPHSSQKKRPLPSTVPSTSTHEPQFSPQQYRMNGAWQSPTGQQTIPHTEMMQQMYQILQRKEGQKTPKKNSKRDHSGLEAFLTEDDGFLENVSLSPPPVEEFIKTKKANNFGWKG